MPRTDWSESWREYHSIEDRCYKTWCRIHWWPDYNQGHVAYPIYDIRVLSSRFGWQGVDVHCGPGTFKIKRDK